MGRAHLTTAQRGYDANHKALRKAWEPRVRAGLVNCWRCTRPLHPARAWHLGHDDADRSITRGPEHIRCNLHAAGIKGAAVTNAGRRRAAPLRTRRW